MIDKWGFSTFCNSIYEWFPWKPWDIHFCHWIILHNRQTWWILPECSLNMKISWLENFFMKILHLNLPLLKFFTRKHAWLTLLFSPLEKSKSRRHGNSASVIGADFKMCFLLTLSTYNPTVLLISSSPLLIEAFTVICEKLDFPNIISGNKNNYIKKWALKPEMEMASEG